MRIALLGRTKTLIATGQILVENGHEVVLIATGRPSDEDQTAINDFRTAAKQFNSVLLERVDLTQVRVELTRTAPEAGISINYPVVLPSEITGFPQLGILNAHGGDLPRYRGNACQAWAILQGESRIAVCIHRMIADRVDEGDILSRRFYGVTENTKIGDVYKWMESVIPMMFVETLSKLEVDSGYILEKQSDNPADSLRCFPRRPEDGRIDWNLSAVQIVRLINASGAPYAGAFGEFEGRRFTIEDAEIATNQTPYLAVPGQVLKIDKSCITVACGEEAIRINKAWFTDDKSPLVQALTTIRQRLS